MTISNISSPSLPNTKNIDHTDSSILVQSGVINETGTNVAQMRNPTEGEPFSQQDHLYLITPIMEQLVAANPSRTETQIHSKVKGDHSLIQEGATILRDIYEKPNETTLTIENKKYYQPQLNLGDLIDLARKIAGNCKYGKGIAGIRQYKNGVAFARIWLQKREDYAEKTYNELIKKWAVTTRNRISDAEPIPRTLGLLKWKDSMKKIEEQERFRNQYLEAIVEGMSTNGTPNDTAFERICRPTPEELRDTFGLTPEQISAADFIHFIYKPVSEA